MARVGLRGLARGTRTSPRGRLGGISSRPIVGVYSGKREVSRCVKPARVRAITAGAAGKGAGVEEPSVPKRRLGAKDLRKCELWKPAQSVTQGLGPFGRSRRFRSDFWPPLERSNKHWIRIDL